VRYTVSVSGMKKLKNVLKMSFALLGAVSLLGASAPNLNGGCSKEKCNLPCPMHEKPKQERSCCHEEKKPEPKGELCKCPKKAVNEAVKALPTTLQLIEIPIAPPQPLDVPLLPIEPIDESPKEIVRNNGPPCCGHGRCDSMRAPPSC
jgi:hypothetical protein